MYKTNKQKENVKKELCLIIQKSILKSGDKKKMFGKIKTVWMLRTGQI